MIKIGVRKNLIYPLMLIIFTFFRQIDTKIMSNLLKFQGSLLLTLIMFLSEFLSGFILLIANYYSINNKKGNNEAKFMGIKLIKSQNKIKVADNCYQIYLFIFFIAFFDFIEFALKTYFLPNIVNNYNSFDTRLRGIVITSSAFLCYFLLKFPLYKHQIISLLIINICLITIIIIEYYQNSEFFILTKILLFIISDHLFNSFKDIIEKYILDYDFVNPFQTLMIEGAFGFIFSFFFCFIENPLNGIKDFFKNDKIKIDSKIYLIICFILHFIFSGGKNVYRILTNRLYSPISKSLADAILDPFLISFFFWFDKNDNLYHNTSKFISNFILSFILVFCACIYNELFVIFFCNLEKDTYLVVSNRAKDIDDIYQITDDNSDSDDEENKFDN